MRVRLVCSMRLSLLAAWCAAASAAPLLAQVAAGEITGVVKDQGGAAAPGATVTVTNVETNRRRIVVSSGDGVYTAPSLAPGEYRVDVQLSGTNGGRPGTNDDRFDGISVLQPEPGQVAFLPVVDAIQEFKIESNSPPAEFGRFNGGVVNLTTRAGTNVFHGALFEFLRNE